MKTKTTCLSVSITLALAIQSPAALAQDQNVTNDAEDESIEKIRITTSRLPTDLGSVPHSVTLISNEELMEQARVTTDLGAMLGNVVPGLGISSGSNSNFSQTLRGRKPAVLIDGVLIGTPLRDGARELRTIAPSAVSSIEVIRGSSALYGNGGAGGVINYLTKEAIEGQFEAQISLGFGGSLTEFEDSETYQAEFMVSGKPGKFDYLVTGTYEDIGLQFDPNGDLIPPDPFFEGGLGDTTNESFFVKLGYDLNDDHRLTFSALSFLSEQGLNFAFDDANPGNRLTGDFQSAVSLESVFQRFEAEGNPNALGTGFDVRRRPVVTDNEVYVVRYQAHDLFLETSLNVVAFQQEVLNRFGFFPGFPAIDPDSPDPFLSTPGANSEIRSEKMGLRIDFNTPIVDILEGGQILYGIELSQDETAQPLSDGRVFAPAMELQGGALFAQLELDITDDFALRTGFRYEDVTVDVDDFTTLFLGEDIIGGELDYDELLVNIGGVYNLTEHWDIFGGFSQGFIVADIGNLIRVADFEGIFELDVLNPQPQVIDNIELGIRGTWDNLRFTFAGYESTSEEGTTIDPLTLNVVRAPEEVFGYETTLEYDINDITTVGATYSFVNGRADFDDNGSFETPLNSARVNPPKFTAYMYWTAFQDWQMQLQLVHSEADERFANVPFEEQGFAEFPLDAFTVINYSVSVPIGDGFVSLGINNLLNEVFSPIDSQIRSDLVAETPDIEFIAGQGRNFLLKYTYNFN